MRTSTQNRIGIALVITCSLSAFLFVNLGEHGLFSSLAEMDMQAAPAFLPDTQLIEELIQHATLIFPRF